MIIDDADASGIHADSLDSAVNDGPPTEQDISFLSNSQQKTPANLLPRFAAAKEIISEADDSTIKTLTKITAAEDWFADIRAFCNRGHKLELRPTFASKSRKVKVLCSFCKNLVSPKNVITCSCARKQTSLNSTSDETFYGCQECLIAGQTCPAPPDCPSLSCDGKCLIKNIGINKTCAICLTTIPAYTKAWFCTAATCKPPQIRCLQCNPSIARDTNHPLPPKSPAYSSHAKSALGNPAPMPGTDNDGRN